MKKRLAFVLIPLLVIALLAGCSKPEEPVSGQFTDGVYEGVGVGYGGDIKLSVVVENGYITEIEVLEMSETPGLGDAAIDEVIAAIIDGQSTEVDIVSGATVSSEGAIEAVEVALGLREAAPQEEEPQTPEAMTFEEGIYEGSAEGFKGDIKVRVIVEGTAIRDIELLEISDTPGMGDAAAEDTIKSVIEFQSTEVDIISGATVSSEATLKAIKNALDNGPVQEEAAEEVAEEKPAEEKPAAQQPAAQQPAAQQPATQQPAAQQPAEQKPAEEKPAPAPSVYKDGAYTAAGNGFYGDIRLRVNIKDDKITSIDIISQDETPGLGDDAIRKVISQAVSKNSANVDIVTGATDSSKGAIDAIKKALDQAKN